MTPLEAALQIGNFSAVQLYVSLLCFESSGSGFQVQDLELRRREKGEAGRQRRAVAKGDRGVPQGLGRMPCEG